MKNPTSRLAVELATPCLSQTSLTITNYTGNTVNLRYACVPGNQPETYGNFVAIWPSSIIPWQAPPIRTMKILGNNERGSLSMDGLSIGRMSYIIGYGVGGYDLQGGGIGTISVSALLSAGGSACLSAPSAISISLGNIGDTSLTVHYRSLPGCKPKSFGHRLGLWEGTVDAYSPPQESLALVDIAKNVNEGDVAMNNVALAINTTYTLVYFAGPNPTDVAAILTFNTEEISG